MRIILAVLALLTWAGPLCAQTANRTGSPVTWDGPTAKHQLGGVCGQERWCLGTSSVVRQDNANDIGGPQALEGYTIVAHKEGKVQLVLGTIGNIELGGASGTVVDVAAALNGGLVVTGPGVVQEAISLSLAAAKPHGSYKGPVNVKTSTYIKFDNGWRIRPSGPDLLLCDPSGSCRKF